MSENKRAIVKRARRVAIKIGSRALVGDAGRFDELAAQVELLKRDGKDVVLISSGAIAIGMKRLKLTARPRNTAVLQACAATGQSRLMQTYEAAFSSRGVEVAQVLLTHSDFADRERYLNARATLGALIDLGVVPIINENDTVATEEIKFGDNDQLAAMVASLVSADLLIVLSDVDGLLDSHSERIPFVSELSEVTHHVKKEKSDLGSGGMASKIEATRRALLHGVHVVIASARDPNTIENVCKGRDVGTFFFAAANRLSSRRHWIAYTLRPKGVVFVDDGAKKALTSKGRSLLPAGVMSVRGDFQAGDPVSIADTSGAEFARGLVRYSVREVALLAGAKTPDISNRLGHIPSEEIVHRDDLILL